MRISEREKFAVIVIALVLVFCYVIFSYNHKEQNIQVTNQGNTTVRQTVVVDKISISEESSYQHFVVSGKNFEFQTRDLTFNVNDTIVIEGNKVFPKNKPFNSIQTY
jgi:ribosomal protein S17